MHKLNKTMDCSRPVTRRDFLQNGTAGVLGVLTAGADNDGAAGREEAGQKGPLKVVEKAGGKQLLWQPSANVTVRFLPPAFEAATAKQGQGPLSLKVYLITPQVQEDQAEFNYELTIEEGGAQQKGKYTLGYSLAAKKDERVVLTQKSALHFDEPLRLNLSVAHTVQVTGQKTVTCTLPLRYGVVKNLALGKCHEVAGYFVLGRGSTSSAGEEWPCRSSVWVLTPRLAKL